MLQSIFSSKEQPTLNPKIYHVTHFQLLFNYLVTVFLISISMYLLSIELCTLRFQTEDEKELSKHVKNKNRFCFS